MYLSYYIHIWIFSNLQQSRILVPTSPFMADPATTMTNDETAPAWKLAVQAGQPMWYIGYGSNMKGSSMKGRSITPLATEVITVPTHYVTFDIFGIPYSEPCYASIAEFPHNGSTKLDLIHGNYRTRVPPLCGVAHLLTPSDFHRLLVTEGSGVVYDIITVRAYRLDDSREPVGLPFTGYTLKAKWPQRPNGIPSARYMVRSRPHGPSRSINEIIASVH